MADSFDPFHVRKMKSDSGERRQNAEQLGGDAKVELRHFCERLDHLEERKSEISDDIKVVNAEIKSAGFDLKLVKVARKWAKERREQPDLFDHNKAIAELYMDVLCAEDGP